MDWGVPDWRDEAAYKPPERYAEFVPYWRWQFVRRKPDVRIAWEVGDVVEADRLGCWDDPRKSLPSTFPGDVVVLGTCTSKRDFFETEDPSRAMKAVTGGNIVKQKFDLSQPIREQIEQARRYLTDAQKKIYGQAVQPRRTHFNRWVVYLRCLDAEDFGAKPRDILEEILGPEAELARAYEHCQRARELRDNFKT